MNTPRVSLEISSFLAVLNVTWVAAHIPIDTYAKAVEYARAMVSMFAPRRGEGAETRVRVVEMSAETPTRILREISVWWEDGSIVHNASSPAAMLECAPEGWALAVRSYGRAWDRVAENVRQYNLLTEALAGALDAEERTALDAARSRSIDLAAMALDAVNQHARACAFGARRWVASVSEALARWDAETAGVFGRACDPEQLRAFMDVWGAVTNLYTPDAKLSGGEDGVPLAIDGRDHRAALAWTLEEPAAWVMARDPVFAEVCDARRDSGIDCQDAAAVAGDLAGVA